MHGIYVDYRRDPAHGRSTRNALAWEGADRVSYIGRRVRFIDWDKRTSGRAHYAGDLGFDGLLAGRILRSPHPYARIDGIDVSRARALPGVHAVVTASDFPAGVRYLHEGAADRPPLADGVVRFVGQEIAAVAAESAEQAEAALQAIRVDYQALPAPLSTEEALAAGVMRLHQRPGGAGNVSREIRRRWGNPDGGRKASSYSVEAAFACPRVAHACMEPNTTVALWNEVEARVHLWTATQAPYFIVREVAHVLGLSQSQVVCHEVCVGGGFGSKSKISEHEAIAAMLARAARRPVRVCLSREEEFSTTKTRHAFRMGLRLYADAQGRLRAIDGHVVVDNGAYDHSGVSVMAAGVKAFGMLYRPDGLEIDARLVDNATQPGGQFRGYGSAQTGFAFECLMDELAERVGCDPIALRLRNANQPAERTLAGAVLSSVRLTACLEAVREGIGWEREKTNRRCGRGVGVAAGVHVSGAYAHAGANRSEGAVDVFADGHVRVRFGGSDAGTGQKTILAQIAAQELGVDIGNVEVLSVESDKTPYDMGAWSSRGTHYTGHAIRMAAIEAAQRLKTLAARRFGSEQIRLEGGMARAREGVIPIGDLVRSSGDATDGVLTTQTSYLEANAEMPDRETGIGNASASYNFAAHAALVSVDRRTGQVRVLDYVAAHDIGTAINPTFVEGQIAGGVAMGLGAALGEELIYEQGKLVNGAYLHYALPRAADLPRIRPILIEGGDANGPYGAKAVGELGVTPAASAIANAVYDAIGVRIRELPITPDKLLVALAENEGRKRNYRLWKRPGRWWIAAIRWAYPRGLYRILRGFTARASRPAAPRPAAQVETPTRLEDAMPALGSTAMPIAGGTDLQLQRMQGLVAPARLISILDIPELRQIDVAADGSVDLGAAASLAQVSAALRTLIPAIAEAIETISSPQIRAMATVGGNLLQGKRCWFYRNDFPCYKRSGIAAPCYAIIGDHRFYHSAINGHRCQAVTPSDLATVLVALDAEATIKGPGGERVVSLASFYTGPGETVVRANELLTKIRIPGNAVARHAAFEKLGLWEGDFALASAAISVKIDGSGRWSDVRIVLGGVAPTPWRSRDAKAALNGTLVTPEKLRVALDRELDAVAHPLLRNAWKLDAVSGLAQRAAERLQLTGRTAAGS